MQKVYGIHFLSTYHFFKIKLLTLAVVTTQIISFFCALINLLKAPITFPAYGRRPFSDNTSEDKT